MNISDVACVDLFCGAGGLTHGLISEGINVVAGIDVDVACRHPFEANNASHFIAENVSSFPPERLQHLFGDAKIKVLAGCAPCQPFSTYSQRYDVIGSPRWGLLYQFLRLIMETLPDLVTMENVPSVVKHVVFEDFIQALTRFGYYVHHDVVDCTAYGLPQNRRRLVLLASRLGAIGLTAAIVPPARTVRMAIGDLPPIGHGDSHPHDRLHAASKLSRLNWERIRSSNITAPTDSFLLSWQLLRFREQPDRQDHEEHERGHDPVQIATGLEVSSPQKASGNQHHEQRDDKLKEGRHLSNSLKVG